MDYNNPQVQLSIIALGISIISICITFYDKIIKNIPKLKVTIHVTNQFEIPDIKNTLKEIVNISVVNKGYIVRDIRTPIIKFYGFEVNGNAEFGITISSIMVNFPKEIGPGKLFDYPVPAKNILDISEKSKTQGKKAIRIIIIDTYGKKYRSNKIQISEIADMINKNTIFK